MLNEYSTRAPLGSRHRKRPQPHPTRLVSPFPASLSNQPPNTPPLSVPVNCSFEVEDFEDEWTYEQKFDLIHGRLLLSCFSNPKRVFEQAFRCLAPGGWLEMQDADFPARCADSSLAGTPLDQWYNYIVAGGAAMGRNLSMVRLYRGWLEEIGFVNVQERFFRWPINTWPRDPHLKKLGFWFQHDLLELMTGLKTALTRGLGWSQEKAEVFLVDVRKDVKDRNIHAYHVM
jgi:SAM-dependent methyltransferase